MCIILCIYHLQEIYRGRIQLCMNSVVSEGDDVLPVVVTRITVHRYDVFDLTPEYLMLSAGDAEALVGDYHASRPITEHQ